MAYIINIRAGVKGAEMKQYLEWTEKQKEIVYIGNSADL
jgi:hypothetical protein